MLGQVHIHQPEFGPNLAGLLAMNFKSTGFQTLWFVDVSTLAIKKNIEYHFSDKSEIH